MTTCRERVNIVHSVAVSGILIGFAISVAGALGLGPGAAGAIAFATVRTAYLLYVAQKAYEKGLENCAHVSPLILDLNGDGVEAGGVAYFDHEGDGFAEASRWADEDDGVLVWDRNGDGVINDGSELFGNNTYIGADGDTKAAHGFAALADLDSNADGVVDENDDNFADLRVMRWTDANDNGIKESGEERLETLSAVGVQSLNTSFVNSDKVDESGNEHRQVGSFTKTDGTTAEMTDVWFVTAQDITTYDRSDIPVHSESIAALPDIAGQGRMYSLRDAMALDAAGELKPVFYGEGRTETRTLEELVSAFAAADMAGDKAGRTILVDKILLRWAGAESVVAYDYVSTGNDWYIPTPNQFNYGHNNYQKLAVIEAFMGHQWRAGEGYRRPTAGTWHKISDIYQSHRDDMYANLVLQTDLKDLNDAMGISLKDGAEEGSTDIADYEMDLSGVKTILDGEDNARNDEFLRVIITIHDDDMIIDAITEVSAEWAYEYSYIKDDIHGNSEVAWLGAESRHVRQTLYSGIDKTIKIAPGVDVESVVLSRYQNNLVIVRKDADGVASSSLTVVGYYSDQDKILESVEFQDGTKWGSEEFLSARSRGAAHVDILNGLQNSADVLDGDAGGNDTLRGYSGNDAYYLREGTDHDVIQEYYDNTGDAGDEIRLGAGIAELDVRLLRSDDGNHLYVQLLGTDGMVSDSLRVHNYYTDDSAKVEKVVFADGAEWDVADFVIARIRGIDSNSLHGESNLSDIFDSDGGGNDTLRGYGGDDVYYLGVGTGHDAIYEHDSNTGDAGDEIRLKEGIAESSVRIRRDKSHLYVEVLGDGGESSDSLRVNNYYTDDSAKVEKVVLSDGTVRDTAYFDLLRRHGGVGNDSIYGLSDKSDIFDGDAGGNDLLYGYSGDDVYYLGMGTGHDVIQEYYLNYHDHFYGYHRNSGDAGDEIRLKEGITESDVRLLRSNDGNHLYVQLLGADGESSDSLSVHNYYTKESAKVEKLLFDSGEEWGAADLAIAQIRGGVYNDILYGESDLSDIFDSDGGGNDSLYAKSGDDVYYLGIGTDHDVIHEYYSNSGDAGDEIRLKSDIANSSVRIRRNYSHLYVEILGADGDVSDSLRVHNYYTDDSAKVEQVVLSDGTVRDTAYFDLLRRHDDKVGYDRMVGFADKTDIFDSDVGGSDGLYGYSGDDVYYLGIGTDHDAIHEYYSNSDSGDAGDEIRLEEGITESDVRLLRSNDGEHLYVQLLDDDGAVSDSLRVHNYYTDASAKVEKVVFADGAEWDADDFAIARIRGGVSTDNLYGESALSDVFDSDAGGNDYLYGYSGNDVYWLGVGTGNDVIHEHSSNNGDAGDEIRLKAGIEESDVRLLRSNDGEHLYVQLLDDDGVVSDSLRVHNYYTDESAKVESIHANGKVLLSTQYQSLIDEMSAFDAGNSRFSDLDALLGHYWQDEVPLSSGS